MENVELPKALQERFPWFCVVKEESEWGTKYRADVLFSYNQIVDDRLSEEMHEDVLWKMLYDLEAHILDQFPEAVKDREEPLRARIAYLEAALGEIGRD